MKSYLKDVLSIAVISAGVAIAVSFPIAHFLKHNNDGEVVSIVSQAPITVITALDATSNESEASENKVTSEAETPSTNIVDEHLPLLNAHGEEFKAAITNKNKEKDDSVLEWKGFTDGMLEGCQEEGRDKTPGISERKLKALCECFTTQTVIAYKMHGWNTVSKVFANQEEAFELSEKASGKCGKMFLSR